MHKRTDTLDATEDYSGGRAALGDLDVWLVRRILQFLGNPRILVRLWSGQEVTTADGSPVETVSILDRGALIDLARRKQLGFGDGYSSGRIRIDGDLLKFLTEVTRTLSVRGSYRRNKLRSRFTNLFASSFGAARNNIHHHYDLGNEFYRLWLDDSMVYTCAYYEHGTETLEQAQFAKLEHVCRKLDLKPGQQVVEAGCGWGGLSLYMAQNYGVQVKAYNISSEQIAYCRQQAQQQQLDDRVEFIEDDFRNIRGSFDKFVSVGMLEHVGLRNYRELGDVINSALKPTGRGLIHSIGRSQPAPIDPWITTRIFPGSYVPSLGDMAAIFEPHRMSVIDVENLRLHYARTCSDWLNRYQKVEVKVAELYDQNFVRAWRLYLTGSIAGFSHGTMQLYQLVFAPRGNNDVPWSRRAFYQ